MTTATITFRKGKEFNMYTERLRAEGIHIQILKRGILNTTLRITGPEHLIQKYTYHW